MPVLNGEFGRLHNPGLLPVRGQFWGSMGVRFGGQPVKPFHEKNPLQEKVLWGDVMVLRVKRGRAMVGARCKGDSRPSYNTSPKAKP